MITFVDEHKVRMPTDITDINAFRRWVQSNDFPEGARAWWLKGEVLLDMSKQQIFSHVLVKTKFAVRLGSITEEEQLGFFFTDGVLLSSFSADVSGGPDGLFVSTATMSSDRVRLIEGKEGGIVELQGAPDMVLEVLSDSSVDKDEVVLKKAYFEAGVAEYWLVDARADTLRFDIYRRGTTTFVATRRRQGWLRSEVFARSFRLCRVVGASGHPDFRLETQ